MDDADRHSGRGKASLRFGDSTVEVWEISIVLRLDVRSPVSIEESERYYRHNHCGCVERGSKAGLDMCGALYSLHDRIGRDYT